MMTLEPDDSAVDLALSDAGLSLPHGDENTALARVIDGYVRRHKGLDRPETTSPAEYWFSPTLYQFDRLSLWRRMTPDERAAAMAGAARTTMQEAYFIEKSGLAYGARMLLLSHTTERRQAYGLLLADEASHLNWVATFVPKHRREGPMDAFAETLGTLVPSGPPMVLVFLLQVLLEGWGVDHYRRLAAHAQDEQVARMCKSIYRDESLHHRLGEVMFDANRLSAHERDVVRDLTAGFLEMVRIGPLAALHAIEQAVGGLSEVEAACAVEDLESTAETQRKLNLLRQLMAVEGMTWLVDDLEPHNLFEPLPFADIARQRTAVS